MSNDSAEIFNDSYERCLSDPMFIAHFYKLFIGSNSEVAQKFANTDLDKRSRMLRASLHMIMGLEGGTPESMPHIQKIGELHSSRQHDVRPELYELWLTCLLKTVEQVDSNYCTEVEYAWRKMLSNGIKIMKAMY